MHFMQDAEKMDHLLLLHCLQSQFSGAFAPGIMEKIHVPGPDEKVADIVQKGLTIVHKEKSYSQRTFFEEIYSKENEIQDKKFWAPILDQPDWQEQWEMGLDVLFQHLKGKKSSVTKLLLPTELIERMSCRQTWLEPQHHR